MEEAREKEFAAFLMEMLPPGVRGTSGVYWQEYGEKITATIKDPSSSDKNLRYFVKTTSTNSLTSPVWVHAMC